MDFTLVFKDVDSLKETDKQKLAERHRLPRPVLDFYLDSLHIRTTPPYDLDSALHTVARRYIDLQERLQQIPASDTQINDLIEQTLKLYQQAHFDRVDTLLIEIKEAAIRLSKEATTVAVDVYLLTAAEASACFAMLEYNEHEIESAEYHYQAAIDLLPQGHDLILAHYLHELAATRRCYYISIEDDADLEIETLFKQALAIREEHLPDNHGDIADTLFQLAIFNAIQTRYAEALPLYLKCLAIKEELLGVEHFEVTSILEELAQSYGKLGRDHEMEQLFLRIIAIKEKMFGSSHPYVADTLYNLADLYHSQKRFEEAELLYLRSLEIEEKIKGIDEVNVWVLSALAALYRSQERYDEAEKLYLRALAIKEQVFGSEGTQLVDYLNDIAGLYVFQNRYEEAESLYLRALGINKKAFRSEHQNVADSHALLAMLYQQMDRLEEAEVLYRKALAIDGLGEDYLDLFIELLQSQDRYEEADEWEARRKSYIN